MVPAKSREPQAVKSHPFTKRRWDKYLSNLPPRYASKCGIILRVSQGLIVFGMLMLGTKRCRLLSCAKMHEYGRLHGAMDGGLVAPATLCLSHCRTAPRIIFLELTWHLALALRHPAEVAETHPDLHGVHPVSATRTYGNASRDGRRVA